MCGIAGLLSFDGPLSEPEVQLVERMTDALAHRGPDDRGVWRDERAALGSRRLAVIDLSPAGHQPMANEDGQIQITYNGEVYNFRDLERRFGLRSKGHRFRSGTDTEVLLHLYEELGPSMARHLNGMFAFAIWDRRSRLLHLARDPYGVKPLFYHRDSQRLRFGSEIKAILADRRVEPRLSVEALHDYLTFDYVPGSQTAFQDIHEVPPGHWMTIRADDGSFESRRFWEPSYAVDPELTAGSASRRARELMDAAVERQLVADVPVGVMLSGGLDSSAIVAFMHRHVPAPIRTYSVGFEDASFNELPYARVVAEHFGTEAREVVITADSVRRMLPAYLRFIDEPYADGSAIPTYFVCERAKGEVVVVLSGEGGDEAFAGYETYSALKAATWGRRVPRWIRHGVIRPLVDRLPVSDSKLSLEFRLKRFLGGLDLSPVDAHVWWRMVLPEARKLDLYTPALRELLSEAPPARHYREVFERPGPADDLARLMRADASVFLPDDLMIKNDRMSMAHSLEARVPFTDPELTEFMSRVPSRLKLPGLRKKQVMRDALRGLLPPAILNKRKVGLEIPYSRWLRSELKDLTDLYLGHERLTETGLFRPEAVRRLVSEHDSRQIDHGRALWGLLNYMMWLELYSPRLV